jgi:Ca2+-transporting ATPase
MPDSRSSTIEIVHDRVPGRVRFRVAGLRGAAPLRDLVEAELPRHEGVRSAAASTLTGTVLVLFETTVPPDRIAAFLEELAHRLAPAAGARPSELRST